MSSQFNQLYRFGPFVIDAEKRVLLRDGEPVPLSPKAFDTLLVLVQHHGEVLEKGQLMEMLWPDSDVEEANLPLHVSNLRKVLGESPTERRYIVTVPGRGYRFAADVQENDSSDVVLARYTKSTVVIQEQVPLTEQNRAGLLPAVSPGDPRKAVLVAAVVVLVLVATATYFYYGRGDPKDNRIRSIAVLPFVNPSADPNTDYLSIGITESLINNLSQLSQLKVIARTTAFRYKGKEADPKSIGRDLNVDAIITGNATQQGDRLMVQADLLKTSDGSQVWGSRYTRKLSDVFAVQEQIAEEIARNLPITLTGQERQTLSKHSSENLKAYQSYLLGRTYLQRQTRKDVLTAISYFQKAIEEDPAYALAYAALTEAYIILTIRGFIDPAEGRRRAEDAARTALYHDPNLAESHAAMGATLIHSAPFNFLTGDQELHRAIELSPNLAVAHQYLAASLMEQGRIGESLEVWQRARELDPLSPLIARVMAYAYLLKRDYSKAQEALKQSYDLGPPFIIWGEIEFYIQNGNVSDALAELERIRKDRSDDPILIFSEGMAYASQGKRAEALRVIGQLSQMKGSGMSAGIWIARIYATLNEKRLALDSMYRAQEAAAVPHFFKDDPVWDPIRNDQRFADLLKRMAIP